MNDDSVTSEVHVDSSGERDGSSTSSLDDELVAMIRRDVSLDPDAAIDSSTDLLLSGLVDSLGVVQIVGWLEDRLDVQIDPVDIVLENFQTVDSMTAFAHGLTSPTV